MAICDGILLIGPTGSGKSPLGDLVEQRGLHGRCYRHFDFGSNLRSTVANETPGAEFSAEELEFLRSVLETGALLEDSHFHLAERILSRFLERKCGDGRTRVVLNGLPRHAGQAEAVDRFVHVRAVVELDCSERVVLERIGTNVGGDRTTRTDDEEDSVCRKLAIFAERTRPLVAHYRRGGCPVVRVAVSSTMTAEEAWMGLVADRAFR